MNIFYLDKSPKICATQHCDKHVVKMILEYAQILSTAHYILDGSTNIAGVDLYKPTHKNHPSAKWVRESLDNYNYLYELFIALLDEYTYRYNKRHKTEKLRVALKLRPANINSAPFTDPALAMPEEFKRNTAIDSYHAYYKFGKAHLLAYTKREKPQWLMEKN